MTYVKPIMPEDCKALTEEIKFLKSQSIFFKKKFAFRELARNTGIPYGSLGGYIKHDTLPTERYQNLKLYVDKVKTDAINFLPQMGKTE